MKEPSPPSRIGRYEIRKELGRGTMGVVYEAHDPALGRTIALKTIQVPFSASGREREDFEKRFLAEARIAARLSHSGIVVVHDVARDSEHEILYIALEHLQGRTLAEVAAEGPLEWREALRIVGRVAEAIRYAHTQGVVHRDIKPANIMLVGSGEPKIMDFGIAKLEAGQLTSTGQFFGTPLYMSPEQALGQPVDGRTDLFSLGSIAYALLTGRPPFAADNVPGILARVAYQHPKPLRDLVPGLPTDVEYVVARAMAKSPADRYPDGRLLAEDVEDILAGRPPRHREGWKAPDTGAGTLASASGDDLPELALEPLAARRTPRRRRRRSVSILVALLAGVTAIYFYLHPADRHFWGRAAAEGRRSRIAEELRAWWGRIVVEPPDAAPQGRAAQPPASPLPPIGTLASSVSPVAEAAAAPEPAAPAAEAPVATVPGATASPVHAAVGDAPEPPLSKAPPEVVATPAGVPATSKDVAVASRPRTAETPGTLAIEFEHHLRRGNLRVWVDDDRVVDEDFDGRVTRKILMLELRKGVVQQRLTLAPGRHDVRVQVRWDDNNKEAHIAGTFRSGATRRLDVQVGRIGGKLSLAWK